MPTQPQQPISPPPAVQPQPALAQTPITPTAPLPSAKDIEARYQQKVAEIKAVMTMLGDKNPDLPVMRTEVDQVRTLGLLPTIDLTLLSRSSLIDTLDRSLFLAFIVRNELLEKSKRTSD